MNKAKIEKAPQQYNSKHLTEESCSQSRSIQEPMQMSSRGKQMVKPSGSDMASERRQPVQMAQFFQKEIDTQNMNIVVASPKGSMRQVLRRRRSNSRRPSRSSSRQHLKHSNPLRSETDLHRGEQDGQRHCRQQAGKVR